MATESSPPVAHHLISAFIVTELAYDPLTLKLGDLPTENASAKPSPDPERPARSWMPESNLPAIRGERKDEPIWKETHQPLGDELFPHIQNILYGTDEQFLRRYELEDRTRNLVQKANIYPRAKTEEDRKAARTTRPNHELVLKLSKAAARRLVARGVNSECAEDETGHHLVLEVQDVEAFHFRTGVLIQLCKLSVVPLGRDRALTAWELQEAVAALSRFPDLCWRKASGPDKGAVLQSPGFGLADIMRSLVVGQQARVRTSRRTFTHTFAQFSRAVDEDQLLRLGHNLAKRYTDDYRVHAFADHAAWVRHFDTVGHCLSREGAATIVHPADGGTLPGFLKDFQKGTLEKNYLPLVVLSLHELAEGLRITWDSAVWPGEDNADQAATIDRLNEVLHRSTSLRLAYRFRQVSTISMHTDFNGGLRAVLGLDELESDLAQDAAEASALLQAAYHTRQESRFRWATSLGSAALAALLATGIGTHLERILSGDTRNVLGQWQGLDAFWLAAGLLTALVFGFTFLVAWKLSSAERLSARPASTVAARKLKLKNLS